MPNYPLCALSTLDMQGFGTWDVYFQLTRLIGLLGAPGSLQVSYGHPHPGAASTSSIPTALLGCGGLVSDGYL